MKAIMYHYVRPYNAEYPHFKNLHIDDFKKQLDYLEKEFGLVSLEHFLKSFEGGALPKGAVLTFDDGLSCHYNHVFPVLMERGLWGIFYVPTLPYTKGKILDVHRTHLLLGRNSGKNVYDYLMSIIDTSFLDKTKIEEFSTLTYTSQQNDGDVLMVKRLLNYFISYEYREQIVDELMQHFVPNEEELIASFYMNPSQIKEMHDSGMIIGSHTVSHPVMSRLHYDAQAMQISESFKYLENIVGDFHHKTFCYPYGGFHSFTDSTERLLSDNGCLYSFNVENRDIGFEDLINRPQALPRYDCNHFKYGQVRKQ